jgi:hypothetical protein
VERRRAISPLPAPATALRRSRKTGMRHRTVTEPRHPLRHRVFGGILPSQGHHQWREGDVRCPRRRGHRASGRQGQVVARNAPLTERSSRSSRENDKSRKALDEFNGTGMGSYRHIVNHGVKSAPEIGRVATSSHRTLRQLATRWIHQAIQTRTTIVTAWSASLNCRQPSAPVRSPNGFVRCYPRSSRKSLDRRGHVTFMPSKVHALCPSCRRVAIVCQLVNGRGETSGLAGHQTGITVWTCLGVRRNHRR